MKSSIWEVQESHIFQIIFFEAGLKTSIDISFYFTYLMKKFQECQADKHFYDLFILTS